MPEIRVFADTNVILEAFRTRCWTAISTHFWVENSREVRRRNIDRRPI